MSRLVTFEGTGQHLANQLVVRDAVEFGDHWKIAVPGSQSGQRVNLDKVDPVILRKPEIYPGEIAAADGLIDSPCMVDHLDLSIIRKLGWTTIRYVIAKIPFHFEAVDLIRAFLFSEYDLHGLKHQQLRLVPQYPDGELPPFDILLDQQVSLVAPHAASDQLLQFFAVRRNTGIWDALA